MANEDDFHLWSPGQNPNTAADERSGGPDAPVASLHTWRRTAVCAGSGALENARAVRSKRLSKCRARVKTGAGTGFARGRRDFESGLHQADAAGSASRAAMVRRGRGKRVGRLDQLAVQFPPLLNMRRQKTGPRTGPKKCRVNSPSTDPTPEGRLPRFCVHRPQPVGPTDSGTAPPEPCGTVSRLRASSRRLRYSAYS